ncbi:PREDICTED: WD repeat-containing protein 3 [Wasmannia auropunctata]|uniref:WD repeat-containing protein 3 n=1 Tax=Wasmannia auropunctata TaxID=64793 RepID=UPI0005EEB1F9|nr:PREDICTED: WD repeat-containing protein 3 [Wasmannia auropunctata]XP_011691527.1 PREDICTED: WD repeat-containing protein 3 [Wasmannia auropunctata]XP_011691535.1 PREDICTED: WD repeat-containing protein 3 [Wasmannia auropunctata]XP_011691542.1 PREDICTED: WD repeat-containing protein 3 [Wasmannia auropunctata]XP_011691549.1 PREDICTED: WD repeat-containing protein 3 [Wasmannia auropunctata]XP_011691551.1 PREDICTED: WD repeat-containing protein 3 [Wasmannia auropunctata]XP_011691556.1 PREDICTE
MGLTKQYLKYVPAGNANIIASPRCNVVFVRLDGQEGRFVAAAACEHVYIWDLRLGEKAQVLSGEKVCVTRLAASPDRRHIAVGYADGTVKTFDLTSGENVSVFVGHKSEITALAYDALGHRLATGSKDTDIIVWDVVAEIGICRLSGHKGVVTKLVFMREHNIIISASKDTFVKFWDLDTEHNFKTLVGHKSEVWSLVLMNDDRYLITGCNDVELRVWKITFLDNKNIELDAAIGTLEINEENEESVDTDMKYPIKCEKVGSILRTASGRVVSLEVDPTCKVLGCHGLGNSIELFYLLSDDTIKDKFAKRLKKQRRKAQKEGNDAEKELPNAPSLKDEIKRLPVVRVSGKAKGLDLVIGKGNELRLCVGVNNNSIELHSLYMEEKNPEVKRLRAITAHGHRTDVRAVCFSSDNLAFATVSGDSVKLWNRPTLACLRTVLCGYALTVTFVPGDRHLIVGLKDGKMLIIDIASGDILEEVSAHSKELWSVTLFPDLKGVASGGGDQTVKFWNFELIQDSDSQIKAKVLSVLHTRTLKLEETVLCVRMSPNNRFVAVSLLDSTIKIFFLDTFKFFVSLYGHKLPALSMDISSDSTLIATGSADRNVKIWGLDFGDCHKSIFAHDDSVTGLSFVPGTHYFFTSGKDGKIKQWDADIFQKITTLQGHAGESWNCCVSPNGVYAASCGSDRVVRLYEKTGEPLVLQDQAEEEREQQESELVTGESTAVLGQKQQALPSRKTVNSEKAAELILECLEISSQYETELSKAGSTDKAPPLPLLMQAYDCTSTEDFLLETFKRVRASELEETLLLLPYSAACDILQRLPNLLKNDYHAELLARLALCLVQAHHGPIVANQNLLPTLEIVKKLAVERISSLRDTVGLNLHGMMYVQRVLEEREGIKFFRDASKNVQHKRKIKRNKEKAIKRAIMNL